MDETPNDQHDDRTDDCAQKARSLSGLIDVQGLTEIGGDQGADDPKNGGQDEPAWFISAGHDELGDHARDKANDNGPDDAMFWSSTD